MIVGIYGAGDSGKTILDLIGRRITEVKVDELIYVDDMIGVPEFEGRRVLTFEQATERFRPKELCFVISQGDPAVRKRLYLRIKEKGYSLKTFADPTAMIGKGSRIGEGCIISPNAFLDANAVVGDNTIVYLGAVIGHDSMIGPHSIVSVHSFVGGHCEVGEQSFLGPGSMVRDRIRMGCESVLAMGAALYRDLPEKQVAIGNPARSMKRSDSSEMFSH